MKEQSKVCKYLGFARKAGKLSVGMGTCTLPQIKGKLKLILIANDTAEGSVEKIVRYAESGSIPYRIYGSSDELSGAAGMEGRNIFGIRDASLAEAIRNEIDSEKEVLQ